MRRPRPHHSRAPPALLVCSRVGLSGGALVDGPRASRGERHRQGPGQPGGCARASGRVEVNALWGRVDAVPRAWTRFRPGKRQPERRSPALERVHQPRGTLTQPRARSAAPGHVHPAQSAFAYTRARSPEGACTRRSSLARPPGCGGGARNRRAAHSSGQPPSTTQAARRRRPPGASSTSAQVTRTSGKAPQAHQPTPRRRPPSTQPPTTSTTRHARHQAENPQPSRSEKHNQGTPPTVTGLTASTARSHGKQVPFSRAISTVLTEGRAAAPTSPHQ